MDRYIPYIKIAVCTQNPGVNDTIREYAAGFEVRAGVKIQVDIMKNCYPLAKKILEPGTLRCDLPGKKTVGYRQLYLCIEHPYDGPGNHIFTSWMGQTDPSTDRKSSAGRVSSHSLAERRISQRTLPGAQPSWPRTPIPLHPHAGL